MISATGYFVYGSEVDKSHGWSMEDEVTDLFVDITVLGHKFSLRGQRQGIVVRGCRSFSRLLDYGVKINVHIRSERPVVVEVTDEAFYFSMALY